MFRLTAPRFEEDEELVLSSQGGYANSLHCGWKLGRTYLTNRRLLFFQPVGIVFEAWFGNLLDVRETRRRYGFQVRNVILLTYRHKAVRKCLKAWIIVADLETWKKKIQEKIEPVLDPSSLKTVLQQLDPTSRDIVNFIWCQRHATIAALAHVSRDETHMHLLHRIKQIINPTAEKTIGVPLLVFERRKMDDMTGDEVNYSWWIAGRRKATDRGKPLLDLFDEGDELIVIIELQGVEEGGIEVSVDTDRLVLSARGKEKDYYETIKLNTNVEEIPLDTSYRNGLLQIRLKKVGAYVARA